PLKCTCRVKAFPLTRSPSFLNGKEKPAVLGHDEAAYAKNRRAVLVY
ncbi:peptidoglycan-associated outer membrane lipoprotein, partial [Salmonella enterica subsp. enterica serovar Enteritidis str. 6.0562-1]